MRPPQLPVARLRRLRLTASGFGDTTGSSSILAFLSASPTLSSSYFSTIFLERLQQQHHHHHHSHRHSRQHSTLLPMRMAGRPQLPFLSPSLSLSASPTGGGTTTPRYFTTQRRRWLRYEALAFAKYTLYFWAAVACLVLGQFVVQQEWLERAHPTPPVWSFLSRMRLRGAQSERLGEGEGGAEGGGDGGGADLGDDSSGNGSGDGRVVDHVKVIQILLDLVARLEDAQIDGAGVVVIAEPGDVSLPPLDIRAKSEPWRRGYVEALLAAAATAEHVEGWVRDRTRNVVCPPDMVVGPSNRGRPRRPLPPGATLPGGAPREEDCDPDPVFPAPAALYGKLLRTRGLTPRQQIAAALAFANYLEYKQDRAVAADLYGRAVLVAAAAATASSSSQGHTSEFPSFFAPDAVAGVDNTTEPAAWIQTWAKSQGSSKAHTSSLLSSSSSPPVSQNLLATLTAYATFQARTGDVAAALPLFVALLQARQSLPPSSGTVEEHFGLLSTSTSSSSSSSSSSSLVDIVRGLFAPPAYPPPPDDGLGPPLPGPQAVCSEAALRLHIGEILYASARKPAGVAAALSSSSSSWGFPFSSPAAQQQQQQHAREEGIAWTREAVDVAEEQLHGLAQAEAARRKKLKKERALLGSAVLGAGGGAPDDSSSAAAKTTCRQCLVAGLDNWATMVAQLARDEARRQQQQQQTKKQGSSASASLSAAAGASSWWPSWLSLWGDDATTAETARTTATATASSSTPHLQRWAAEEKVIQERRRRARELLEEVQKAPPQGFMALFTA